MEMNAFFAENEILTDYNVFQESRDIHLVQEHSDLFKKSLKKPRERWNLQILWNFSTTYIQQLQQAETESRNLFSFFLQKMGIYFAFKSNKNINLFYTLLEFALNRANSIFTL